jgi:hypothetical protein
MGRHIKPILTWTTVVVGIGGPMGFIMQRGNTTGMAPVVRRYQQYIRQNTKHCNKRVNDSTVQCYSGTLMVPASAYHN